MRLEISITPDKFIYKRITAYDSSDIGKSMPVVDDDVRLQYWLQLAFMRFLCRGMKFAFE